MSKAYAVFAAMLAAALFAPPSISVAAALPAHFQLAAAEGYTVKGAEDYMDDSGDSIDDDEVPVIGLPPNDDGTESHSSDVTPVPNQYTRQHPVELEDEDNEDDEDSRGDDGDDDEDM